MQTEDPGRLLFAILMFNQVSKTSREVCHHVEPLAKRILVWTGLKMSWYQDNLFCVFSGK